MTAPRLTPSQTVGPFFHPTLLRHDCRRNVLAQPDTVGERIRLEGHIYDGAGEPVPDALVEIWQANSHGRYHHPLDQRPLPLDPTFTGFGRTDTDAAGHVWFETIKPGPVPFLDGRPQAPHISVTIFARGLLNHLSTRLYFADDPTTPADPILLLVPAARRPTLLAHPTSINETTVYHFNILLQGPAETPFFNV